MHALRFNAFCGMSWEIAQGELDKCRQMAANILRKRKRSGHFINKLKENVWECQEPENCFMVPDTAGILVLSEINEVLPEEDFEEDFSDE